MFATSLAFSMVKYPPRRNLKDCTSFFQYDETLKPSYISVDLSEVELAEYDGPSASPNNSLLLDVSTTFSLFYHFLKTFNNNEC